MRTLLVFVVLAALGYLNFSAGNCKIGCTMLAFALLASLLSLAIDVYHEATR